uniref:SRP_SPB domain-containing protein n=1 Tax=Steinernema glaseri TaxID=37863 RepID=A0A1I7YAW7_9BILA
MRFAQKMRLVPYSAPVEKPFQETVKKLDSSFEDIFNDKTSPDDVKYQRFMQMYHKLSNLSDEADRRQKPVKVTMEPGKLDVGSTVVKGITAGEFRAFVKALQHQS